MCYRPLYRNKIKQCFLIYICTKIHVVEFLVIVGNPSFSGPHVEYSNFTVSSYYYCFVFLFIFASRKLSESFRVTGTHLSWAAELVFF